MSVCPCTWLSWHRRSLWWTSRVLQSLYWPQRSLKALWDRGSLLLGPQKLQLVLAPLHSLASRALEHGLPDPSSLLAHSFQQLDRIDSLSEQISFLEEQLGSCECHPLPTELPGSMGPVPSLCPQRDQRLGQSSHSLRERICLEWGKAVGNGDP